MARNCRRSNLGVGAAYAVNSAGEVVGGVSLGSKSDCNLVRKKIGPAMLWRNGKAIALTAFDGIAYGISDRGTIVGTMGSVCAERYARGFVADADAVTPQARPLDELVAGLNGRHIVAAFGIDAAGRILCIVAATSRDAHLAVLIPQ